MRMGGQKASGSRIRKRETKKGKRQSSRPPVRTEKSLRNLSCLEERNVSQGY